MRLRIIGFFSLLLALLFGSSSLGVSAVAAGQQQKYSIQPTAGVYPASYGPLNVGWMFGGVHVDNLSPHWWTIAETGDVIPPHTLGWGRDFEPYLASVNFLRGPAVSAVATPSDDVAITLVGVGESVYGEGTNVAIQYQLDSSIQALIDKLDNPDRLQVAKAISGSTSFTNTDLVAAPGAGFRIRVFAVGCSVSPTSVDFWQVFLIGNGGSGTADAFSSFNNTFNSGSSAPFFGTSGYPLNENQPLRVRHRKDSSSSDTLMVAIIYSIEPV